MDHKYYRLEPKLAAEVVQLFDQWDAHFKAAKRLSRKLGAHPNQVYTTKSGGHLRVTGFIFAEPPSPKSHWKKLPGTNDGYEPTRKNGEVLDAVRAMSVNICGHIEKATGTHVFQCIDGQMYMLHAAVYRVGEKQVYISARGKQPKLKRCTRVSDLQFEKATGKKE